MDYLVDLHRIYLNDNGQLRSWPHAAGADCPGQGAGGSEGSSQAQWPLQECVRSSAAGAAGLRARQACASARQNNRSQRVHWVQALALLVQVALRALAAPIFRIDLQDVCSEALHHTVSLGAAFFCHGRRCVKRGQTTCAAGTVPALHA